MEYKIYWTDLAYISLDKNLEYLKTHWSKKVIIDFINRIEVISKQIKYNPLQFPKSTKHPKYHKALIHENVSMYYRIDKLESLVYITLIWANKQNPNTLNKLL